MQIKMTLTFHVRPVRIPKIKTQASTHDVEDVEQGNHSSIACGNVNINNHLRNQFQKSVSGN